MTPNKRAEIGNSFWFIFLSQFLSRLRKRSRLSEFELPGEEGTTPDEELFGEFNGTVMDPLGG